jgi:hypothetical protein
MDKMTLSGRSGAVYYILPVMIGGVAKSELPAQVQVAGQLSSLGEQAMRSSQFRVLRKRQTRMQILLSPKQLGFRTNPSLSELFDKKRLAEWSGANLAGHVIRLNPAEVGPHLAIQYQSQKMIKKVAVAMEPIVWSSLKYPVTFAVERINKATLILTAHWLDPEDDIPLDLPFAFWLQARPKKK